MTAGRWLTGTSSLALTVLLVAAGHGADLLGALLIAMAVSVFGPIALSSLSPLAVPLVGRLLGAVLRTGVLGELAQAILRDAVRRSAATAAPVIVLVGLLVGLTGALNSPARAIGPRLAAEGVRSAKATARIGERKVRLRTVARLPEVLENGSDTFLVPRDLVPPAMLADAPTETMLRVAPGASPGAVADRLRAAGFGEVRTLGQWADARVREQQSGTMGIMGVLMGMSGLYAAIAVVNAVVIAAAERRAEFAVARATGLSRGQVVRMAVIESAAVTLIGLFLGSLVAAAALAGFYPGPGGVPVLAVPWPLLGLLTAGSLTVTAVGGALTALVATKPSPTALVAARE